MTSSPTISPLSIPTSSTPNPHRERSDTVLTTSSLESDQYLQTPQTPSILGLLNAHHAEPAKYTTESPTTTLDSRRNRQDSYGFGHTILSSSPETIPRLLPGQDAQSSSASSGTTGALIQPDDPSHFNLEPPIQLDLPSINPIIPQNPGSPEAVNHRDTSLTAPVDPNYRLSISTDASTDTPESITDSRRSKLKAVVRRKLERSKSSFRSLRKPKDEEDDTSNSKASSALDITIPSTTLINEANSTVRPRKSRIKSLLTMSRAPSSTSIRSTHVTTLPRDHQIDGLLHPPQEPAPSHVTSHIGHHEITVRDFAQSIPSLSPTHAHARHFSVESVAQINTSSPQIDKNASPVVSDCPDGVIDITEETPSAHPIRIRRPRAISMPLFDSTSQDLMEEGPEVLEEEKLDYFDTMLPRELKVLVLKTLLDIHTEEGGNKRWDGETGGRRELIKLSRNLCLDGQLWHTINLTPYAHVLHPNTMDRIITHSLPFITTLSCQGLDGLRGVTLLSALSPFEHSSNPRNDRIAVWLPNLRNLDLRGTTKIKITDICTIISGSPGLKSINLKAVPACTSEVIRTIARSTRQLESLDVSRCADLTLGDMIFLISTMDENQQSKMKCLKIGGMKSYGRHASEFLPLLAKKLINLETFDAQGCKHLFDDDFEKFSQVLEESNRTSQITHLNLSGCSALKGKFLIHLTGKLPNLRKLELANLSESFKEDTDQKETDLIKLFKTTPQIEKIDLDLTGIHGGVSDKILDVLSRFRHDDTDEIVGKNLVELRIGHAKDVTSDGLVRFIKSCPKLNVIEIDNTPADNTVLRTFLKYRPRGNISVIDCRSISISELDKIVPSTRSRFGHEGWEYTPFQYDQVNEINSDKPIVKSFQSWRNTTIPKSWTEIRTELDKSPSSGKDNQLNGDAGKDMEDRKKKGRERKNSWWASSTPNSPASPSTIVHTQNVDEWEESDNGNRGCAIM